MKILIIDDHAVIHQGLRRMLDDEFPGSLFGDARHAQQALDLLEQGGWEVAILDIGLPGRGGLDLLKQIHAERPHLPVIVFSMHEEEHYAMRAFKAGASAYLAKECALEQLIAAIRKAIAGGKYISPAFAEQLATALGRDRQRPPHEILSDREYEVLRMIAAGNSGTAIADRLALSIKTVSTYRARILEKLQLKSASELVRYAIDQGLDCG